MELLNFCVLLSTFAFLEHVAAGPPPGISQGPVDPVPLCAHHCLNLQVPKLCPDARQYAQLRTCLCKQQTAEKLRAGLSQCLKTSKCSDKAIQDTLRYTHTNCDSARPNGSSTSTSSTSTTASTSSTTGKSPSQKTGSTTPLPQAQKPKTHAQKSNSSSGLSTGASAGIGVGVVVIVLAAIGIIGYVIFKRRRRQQQERQRQDAENKPWLLDNNQPRDAARAELGGQEVAMTQPHQFKDGSMPKEAPPAYVHEKEGAPIPISELASPTDEPPTHYSALSQVHELPSPENNEWQEEPQQATQDISQDRKS